MPFEVLKEGSRRPSGGVFKVEEKNQWRLGRREGCEVKEAVGTLGLHVGRSGKTKEETVYEAFQ